MPATSNHVDKCSLCDGPLQTVLELAPTPPANELQTSHDPDKELYALNLVKCTECHHLQLDTEISMFRLFKHYVYTSNTSASNLAYFHQYADNMMTTFHPSFVVDIGSNDGTFLHFFPSKKLGVDPAENIARIARENGIPTECAFFNELTATKIASEHGKADLITCNNMFAHNRNLNEVLLGVKALLAPGGTFVWEVAYAPDMLNNGTFDLIYHEHFHHWHLAPALNYFQRFGLKVVDASKSPTHGGSIRVYVEHDKGQDYTDRMRLLLFNESVNFDSDLGRFCRKVPALKEAVTHLIKGIKANNQQVSILGYPAKACTLSYYFGLDSNTITSVYDDNPLKIGKLTHQGQLIKPALHVERDKPDYLLVLAWNYADELTERFKMYHTTGGRFIVPLPKLRVI